MVDLGLRILSGAQVTSHQRELEMFVDALHRLAIQQLEVRSQYCVPLYDSVQRGLQRTLIQPAAQLQATGDVIRRTRLFTHLRDEPQTLLRK
jgi:hypothetical protein